MSDQPKRAVSRRREVTYMVFDGTNQAEIVEWAGRWASAYPWDRYYVGGYVVKGHKDDVAWLMPEEFHAMYEAQQSCEHEWIPERTPNGTRNVCVKCDERKDAWVIGRAGDD